jgi:hypothetical protein
MCQADHLALFLVSSPIHLEVEGFSDRRKGGRIAPAR